MLTEAPDPRTNHFAHTVGQGHRVECPSQLRQVVQDLADEERVAVGLAVQRVGKRHRGVVETTTGTRLHERHHTRVIQAGELDTRHALLPVERGQRFEERM
jgi:hypothetical protein